MPPSRHWNSAGIAVPASRYSHAVLTTQPTAWLHLSGQVGVAPDGTIAEGLAAQLDQCLANIEAALIDAGMTRANLVKLTYYLTSAAPDDIATYRARRDAYIGSGTPPASTLLVVSALAHPALVVEVDAIAAA